MNISWLDGEESDLEGNGCDQALNLGIRDKSGSSAELVSNTGASGDVIHHVDLMVILASLELCLVSFFLFLTITKENCES